MFRQDAALSLAISACLRWDVANMKITFCGAAGTTTGSKHLIEVNNSRILLDCGLYQGRRAEAMERNRDFPFDPAKIDCVVLSHAHIDHAGNLPHLCKRGFTGNIFSTPATRDLCSIMLPDAAHIHESDISWLNRHRKRDDLPELEPSYRQVDAEKCLRQFVTLGYERHMHIADGVRTPATCLAPPRSFWTSTTRRQASTRACFSAATSDVPTMTCSTIQLPAKKWIT
jgi:metallo-beta-lactamase family protein